MKGLHCSAPLPLTARDPEVAGLAARRLTNREIAATLVISQRTAESDVANILDNLGLISRAQLAASAVEHDLLTTPPQ